MNNFNAGFKAILKINFVHSTKVAEFDTYREGVWIKEGEKERDTCKERDKKDTEKEKEKINRERNRQSEREKHTHRQTDRQTDRPTCISIRVKNA